MNFPIFLLDDESIREAQKPVLRIPIRNPKIFWPLDPGSVMGENPVFRVKILQFFWSGVLFDPESGMEKFGSGINIPDPQHCIKLTEPRQIQIHKHCFTVIRRLQRNVVYLGWPIAPSYMSQNAVRGGGGSCGVSANKYSCAHGAQINFGELTP